VPLRAAFRFVEPLGAREGLAGRGAKGSEGFEGGGEAVDGDRLGAGDLGASVVVLAGEDDAGEVWLSGFGQAEVGAAGFETVTLHNGSKCSAAVSPR
jgi:hypothetical protein